MANGLAPVLFTTCGVVVAGLVGFSFLEPVTEEQKPRSLVSANTASGTLNDTPKKSEKSDISLLQPNKSADADEAKPKKTIKLSRLNFGAKKSVKQASRQTSVEPLDSQTVKKPLTESLPEKQVSELPRFNVISVDKDGSMVVAGQGPKEVPVELRTEDRILSSVKTNSAGEFVFALDRVLDPGAHQLYLQLKNEEDKILQSPSFAFVDIPEKGELGEVTVLLAEAGKPSKLVQKPRPAVADKTLNKPEKKFGEDAPTSETSALERETSGKSQSVVSNTASTSVDLAKPDPVFIEAVDVENSTIYIAGTGEPDTSVNLYFENDYLGSAQVSQNGAFLFEGTKTIKPGRYDIRADMVRSETSERVDGRAEVKLIHKPDAKNPKQELAGLSNPSIVDDGDTETPTETTDQQISSEDADATKKPEITSGSAVIIRRGDSLWTVARRNYGAGIRYTTIFDANRDQVRNPHRIYPGQVLKIPEEALSVE
jgi:nucleoid-associated protein YgaU